ncbi:MAG: hypothetical protein E7591_09960 [Ruminococcaceae bacterium]|nr:hypothetical protein [Oscillospiraceae bacterium]
MKKTTKIIAIILSALMLVSVFTACNKKTDKKEKTPEVTEEVKELDPELNLSGTIPDGGAYHSVSGEVVGSTNGETQDFPKTLEYGDKFYYGDYNYIYSDGSITDGHKGWVAETDKKDQESYGKLLESINGAPVISINACFKDCVNLKYSPKIPETVYSMASAYSGCTSLVQTPIFPESLINMPKCFSGCMSLTMSSDIPESVEDMSEAFYQCTNLIKAPVIPASVKNMKSAFAFCFSLEGEVTVNADPENYDKCFDGTMNKFTLTGDTKLKAELAATSSVENITY